MTDKNDSWEADESPTTPVDPRISEMIEYAGSAMEVVLNAEFLLDDWVTQYLQGMPKTYQAVRRQGMTAAEKFFLVMGEFGAYEDDEYGSREVFGFLGELLRLRARAGRETNDGLLDKMVGAFMRHGGEEAREECAESFDRLGLMKTVVAGYLTYAQAWITDACEDVCDEPIEDGCSDAPEDPGWEPREQGGSCNFIMGDP